LASRILCCTSKGNILVDFYFFNVIVEDSLIEIKAMAKEDTIKIQGSVEELLPNMTFSVVLENGMKVHCHLCGKMKMRNIRVSIGDLVTVEMSPYDLTKGRIVYRQK
jgi:translation initiation factor IF-1